MGFRPPGRARLLALGLTGAVVLLLTAPGAAPGAHAGASPPHAVPLTPAVPAPLPLTGLGPAQRSAAAAIDLAWSTAYILYGAGDPSGYLFGQGSVMAVDDAIQNTTSFGGEGVDGLSNITLVYNNGTVGYWSYANSTTTPSARSNSSFESDASQGFAVLFGGLVSLRTQATTNDTWRYWFVNQTWENVSRGPSPPARENAAFAVDPSDGIGLLEGGINPDYATGSSTGAVLWNDTWAINLTTLAWAPVATTGAPPPMYGSSMVWDPVTREFVLFGGCAALACANGVWVMPPGGTRWTRAPVASGSVPSARGSASFVWDPVDNVTLLYGGFDASPSAADALGDTFALSANLTAWSTLSDVNGPPPEYDAAAAFADYPGCVGMWVQGGSPAAAAIEYNDYLLAPSFEPGLNCFSPISGGTSGPPKKCTNLSAEVTVQVVDVATGVGIPGSTVEVEGSCGQTSGTTGAAGFLNLSDAAPDSIAITARHPDFHTATANATLTGSPGQRFVVPLTPYPELHAHVLGRNATATFPVVGAPVATGAIIVGNTSTTGWVNATAPPSLNGSLTVTVTPVDFSTGAANVSLPYTGNVYANLTVAAYGAIDVELIDALTGAPLSRAAGHLNFLGPLGANSTLFVTDGAGWYNTSLEAGNYSVTESIAGYFPNASAHPFYHPWITPTVVVLGAVPEYGADVDVRVLNSVLATPVPNATVTFGGSTRVVDDPQGWSNATNLGPPGYLTVSASAPGYYPNRTTITIAPYAVVALVLHLVPAPPCSAFAACPPVPTPPAAFVGLSFLPGPGAARDLLLVAPAVVVVAGALYVVLARRAGPRPPGPVAHGTAGEVYQRRPAPPAPSEGG